MCLIAEREFPLNLYYTSREKANNCARVAESHEGDAVPRIRFNKSERGRAASSAQLKSPRKVCGQKGCFNLLNWKQTASVLRAFN